MPLRACVRFVPCKRLHSATIEGWAAGRDATIKAIGIDAEYLTTTDVNR
jgi:hypothetical protein